MCLLRFALGYASANRKFLETRVLKDGILLSQKLRVQMQSSSFLFKPGKAIVITKYHSPTIAYEQVCRNTVKCAAIVDTSDGITAPFLTQFVCFNVDPILGKILWHQIRISYNFCVGLTSWLFYQWRKMEKKRGEGSTKFKFAYLRS